MQPAKDELTQRQARDEFGAKWLKEQEYRVRIKGYRRGAYQNSPIIYSRIELMALEEAEKRFIAKKVRRG